MDERRKQLRDQHIQRAFDAFNKQRNNQYTLVGKMSSNGAFSAVFEVKDKSGRALVLKAVDTAIVDIALEPEQVIHYVEKEFAAMKQCRDCPYIMDLVDGADILLDPATNEHVFLLFMPKMQVASRYFEQNGSNITTILSLAKDICRALDYCHSKNILHRDVKPDNIFYSPEKGHFVLSDFGISRSLFNHDHAVTKIGSIIAPEIQLFRDLHGRMNSDIYSLGMTVLLLNGGNTNSVKVLADRFNDLPADIKKVITTAIDGDPAVRYQTARDFLRAIEAVEPKSCPRGNTAQDAKSCAAAFLRNDYNEAQQIAIRGHKAGMPVMTCLYAYILACQQKVNEALTVLSPLVSKGDAVATGLYGIIGRLLTAKSDPVKDREMIECIKKSAEQDFSVAQYYVGRWYIDGQCGFPQNIEHGMEHLFAAVQHGFRPAMYYFRNALKRHAESFVSVQSMMDLMAIALDGFSKDNFAAETIHAIVSAY